LENEIANNNNNIIDNESNKNQTSHKLKLKDDTKFHQNNEIIDDNTESTQNHNQNEIDDKYESKFDAISRSLINKKELMNKLIAISSNNTDSYYESINILDENRNHGTSRRSNKKSSSLDRQKQHQSENNANILKVHLENQTIKSFKYDQNTTVKDVLNCLKEKLNLNFIEYFGLCIRVNNEKYISKYILLDETRPLYKLNEVVYSVTSFDTNNNSDQTNTTYQCLFRFIFTPSSYQFLMKYDENSFNYLYEQVILLRLIYFKM
jgi:hypothetical protein